MVRPSPRPTFTPAASPGPANAPWNRGSPGSCAAAGPAASAAASAAQSAGETALRVDIERSPMQLSCMTSQRERGGAPPRHAAPRHVALSASRVAVRALLRAGVVLLVD